MKCPKCSKEINFLNNHVSGSRYHLTVDEKGKPNYDEPNSFDSDGFIDEYRCPECDAVLFTNEIDAVEFLKFG